jgi:hypothetical protein
MTLQGAPSEDCNHMLRLGFTDLGHAKLKSSDLL